MSFSSVPDVLADRLRAAGCISPNEEARELRERAPDDATLERWVSRRETGEPLAWITGRTVFCGLEILVEPGVYVPRPHTQELARKGAELLPERGRAVDLCTGSGAISVVMSQVIGSHVVGVDLDPRAVACARTNGVNAVAGDLGEPLGCRSADLVTVVPPYVPTDELRFLPSDVQRFEPRLALDGGPDGLDVARRAVVSASRLLRERGWLLIELGGDQDQAVSAVLERSDLRAEFSWRDDDGGLRGLAARLLG